MRATLLCLFSVVAYATAISISAGAAFDGPKGGIAAEGGFQFPIPFLGGGATLGRQSQPPASFRIPGLFGGGGSLSFGLPRRPGLPGSDNTRPGPPGSGSRLSLPGISGGISFIPGRPGGIFGPIFPFRPRPPPTTTTQAPTSTAATTASVTATTEGLTSSTASSTSTSTASTSTSTSTSTDSTSASTSTSTDATSTSAGTSTDATSTSASTSTDATSTSASTSTDATSTSPSTSTDGTSTSASTESASVSSTAESTSASTEPTTTGQPDPRMADEPDGIVSRIARQLHFGRFPMMIPSVDALISAIPNVGNASSVSIPDIVVPSDSSNRRIPGLSDALDHARQHLLTAIGGGENLAQGLQEATSRALVSDDPEGGMRALMGTILDTYFVVAANCPLMIVGSAVMQEGIRLALEVARAASNAEVEGGFSVSA